MRDDDKRIERQGRRPTEEINVMGSALVDKVKDLIREGNVRRIIVRRSSGETLMEIPLTAGVGVAALLTLLAPVLAALAAIAALVAQFRVEIERDHDRPRHLVDKRDERD
jgi:xanthine/CO dehydrogenase XdhC/CoxF family maturation factor